MSKFGLGEQVITVTSAGNAATGTVIFKPGQVVTVIRIGGPRDYGVYFPQGITGDAWEYELRKLPGDEKPDFMPPAVREIFKPSETPKAPVRKRLPA